MSIKEGFINCNNNPHKGQADPYIFEHGGTYYIYCTNSAGIPVYKTNDLTNWEYCGLALKQAGFKEFWAPCVYFCDNKFYMYYSSFEEISHDVHLQRIKVAQSNYADRDFKYICDLTQPFSIDPHVITYNNQLYMFYSINDYEAQRAGTYIVLDKMISPIKLEGKPVVVVRPTLDEEIFLKDRFKPGQHWHTLEGAFYINEDDHHYCLYSGNCYMNESYYVGYATAKGNPLDLRDLKWKKYPDDATYLPIIKQNEQIEGTGHNSAIKIDDKWYIIYHARDKSEQREQADTRRARISEMTIKNGSITVKMS